MNRVCSECGQPGDGPMAEWVQDMHDGGQQFHYDCLPNFILKDHPEIQPLVDAAKAGKRGDELAATVGA